MTKRAGMHLRAGRILTPDGLVGPGWVHLDGEQICEITYAAPAAGEVTDLGDVLLTPGLLDTHCHGGGGAAFTDGAAAARRALDAHRAHGTTTTMASLVTDTIEVLEAQLEELAPLVASGELLGVHLEGPWLSPQHRGAHDPGKLRPPTQDDLARLLDAAGGVVRMVTLAPELDGGLDAVTVCVERGVVAAVGHSDATYAVAQEAFARGATVATHLCNAMRPLHHREPGIVGAAMAAHDVLVELIVDGVHLHPAMTRLVAEACAGRFVLITDAMAAAGAPDGRYLLGPLDVEVTDGVARLVSNGAIAGSTLTLDTAVRLAVQDAGLPLDEVLAAATSRPAGAFGFTDRGELRPGARADLAVWDADLRVTRTMLGGIWV